MERGEEEWKGWTTAHKVTDCLVAESSLCPSFLDIFLATQTRVVPGRVQSRGYTSPNVPPRHILLMSARCAPAKLSTALLFESFLNLTAFCEPQEERQSEGGKRPSHSQNI